MTPINLFAVHISDGPLSASWQAGGFALAAGLVFVASYRAKPESVPRIGLLTAAFFVGSQIHFRTGISSVHLLLNGLLGVLLGLRAPLAVAPGLTLQTLLFDHGGKGTLGINCCIYMLPALLTAVMYPPLRRLRPVGDFGQGVLLGAGTAGLTVALQAVVLWLGGQVDLRAFAAISFAAHAPVILVEGVGVGFVVRYVARVVPEWLPPGPGQPPSGNTSSNGTSH